MQGWNTFTNTVLFNCVRLMCKLRFILKLPTDPVSACHAPACTTHIGSVPIARHLSPAARAPVADMPTVFSSLPRAPPEPVLAAAPQSGEIGSYCGGDVCESAVDDAMPTGTPGAAAWTLPLPAALPKQLLGMKEEFCRRPSCTGAAGQRRSARATTWWGRTRALRGATGGWQRRPPPPWACAPRLSHRRWQRRAARTDTAPSGHGGPWRPVVKGYATRGGRASTGTKGGVQAAKQQGVNGSPPAKVDGEAVGWTPWCRCGRQRRATATVPAFVARRHAGHTHRRAHDRATVASHGSSAASRSWCTGGGRMGHRGRQRAPAPTRRKAAASRRPPRGAAGAGGE